MPQAPRGRAAVTGPTQRALSSEMDGASMDWDEAYWMGYSICWFILFVGCWIYCIAVYGFLFGVGLGWLPSAIVATLVSLLWPLVLIVILIAVVLLVWALTSG